MGVRHNGHNAMGGDGQVSFGNAVLKSKARKIRKIYNDTVLAGFAGATILGTGEVALILDVTAVQALHKPRSSHQPGPIGGRDDPQERVA